MRSQRGAAAATGADAACRCLPAADTLIFALLRMLFEARLLLPFSCFTMPRRFIAESEMSLHAIALRHVAAPLRQLFSPLSRRPVMRACASRR